MKTLLKYLASVLLAMMCCTADARTAEEATNEAVARRIYDDGLSRGVFSVPYTADFVGHGSRGRTFTHEAGMAEARGWRSAFPDLVASVDHLIADGDMVAIRWTARGTNTGTGNGLTATGKKVETSGIAMFRFEDGKVAEEWVSADSLGLMRQLGLLPQPTASTAPASRAATAN